MKRRIFVIFMAMILCLTVTACGGSESEAPESEGTAVTESTGGTVDLSVVPDNCEFATAENFAAGMALLTNTDPSAAPVTMEALEDAFGTEPVYYADCDREEYGNVLKTYGWFSEEDWGNSKVAVAVTFMAPEGSNDFSYYMHTAQGNF